MKDCKLINYAVASYHGNKLFIIQKLKLQVRGTEEIIEAVVNSHTKCAGDIFKNCTQK
jgi:hypothetical protein